MLNIEGLYSAYFIKKRLSKAKPPFEILLFIILRFYGLLFDPAKKHTKLMIHRNRTICVLLNFLVYMRTIVMALFYPSIQCPLPIPPAGQFPVLFQVS